MDSAIDPGSTCAPDLLSGGRALVGKMAQDLCVGTVVRADGAESLFVAVGGTLIVGRGKPKCAVAPADAPIAYSTTPSTELASDVILGAVGSGTAVIEFSFKSGERALAQTFAVEGYGVRFFALRLDDIKADPVTGISRFDAAGVKVADESTEGPSC